MINFLMGNYRWVARELAGAQETTHWVELGAGSGSLVSALSKEMIEQIKVTGIDFAPRPVDWPDHWDWKQGDMFEILNTSSEIPGESGVIANLFLHHFTDEQLNELGKTLTDTFSLILACEPVRRKLHQWQGCLLYPLVNQVTRHDMQVSIEAGFLNSQLGELFLNERDDWTTRIDQTFLGSYRFSASRHASK